MMRIIHVRISRSWRFASSTAWIDRYINKYFESYNIQAVDIDFIVTNMENRNIYTQHLCAASSDVSTEIVNNLSNTPNILSIRTRSV